MSNITQIVNVDKHKTTLKKGVVASGLGKTLSESGPYTIFAPSDKAFEKLDKKLVESLLQPVNKAKLTELLNHHVVEGKIRQKDFKDGEKLKTLSGGELHVAINEGVVTVNGAQIEGQGIDASNGSVFSLDTVIEKK